MPKKTTRKRVSEKRERKKLSPQKELVGGN
jgi:hypothetical protein